MSRMSFYQITKQNTRNDAQKGTMVGLRIICFLIILAGTAGAPWPFLIIGGILYSIFFTFPAEIPVLALLFEIYSGVKPGTISLPLAISLTAQHILIQQLRELSFFSLSLVAISAIILFIASNMLLTVFWGAFGIFGFKLFGFL